MDRIRGLDSSGTAFAVVDPVGRFVDIGLLPGWWPALGASGVAAALLEALECARMKAALVPLILRRQGRPRIEPPSLDPRQTDPRQTDPRQPDPLQTDPRQCESRQPDPHRAGPAASLPPPTDPGFLDAARSRLADAYRLIDDADKRQRAQQTTRVLAGPAGLFRLRVRGSRPVAADVPDDLTEADGDLLAADARAALTELRRDRSAAMEGWGPA